MPGPTEGWARQVYPDADDPLARLWEEISYVTRLDADDPVAAWRERFAQTGDVGRRLSELELDSVHFEGPGTDLTVGLLPTSNWQNATETTVDGLDFVANLPSEELTSTPDPARAEGVVRSTRPLVLNDGTLIEGHPRALRRRSCRRGRRRRRRRGTAGAHLGRRRSAPARRGRARRPRGPHRPARDGLLQHAARRERGEPPRARRRLRVARRRGGRREDQPLRAPPRLHDRQRRGRRSPASRRTAHACRSCATAAGRSSACGIPGRSSSA